MTRTASIASLLAIAGISTAAPRYAFEPGQEITYRNTHSFKYGEGDRGGEIGGQTDWTVWVVRANPDGSYRVVFKQDETSYQAYGSNKNERPKESRLAYADIFPDGRVTPNDSLSVRIRPGNLFPRLPKDDSEAAKGWSWEQDGGKVTATPVKSDTGFRFEAVTDSAENKIYLSTRSETMTFDGGRIVSGEIVSTQKYGFDGKGTGTIKLLGVKKAELSTLAAEEGRYFESVRAYGKATSTLQKLGSAAAAKQLEEALATLKAAPVTHPVLKGDLDHRVKQHGESVKYILEEAGRREKYVGKPAEPFATTDIDGKAVKLADLKGKVVVLDFWYRGCGWCIKAMPQMNGLTDDFAGQQVAIFGMNTDRDEKDARLVIEQMSLKYPTLKAEGLPEKFGVRGFPTLVVIDQQGIVHDFHVGYTPTLREDVGRQIRELLEKK